MQAYHGNIEEVSKANENFRTVLFTGEHSQLVVMSLAVGEDIGMEVHNDVDQFFRVESGQGKAVIAGVEYPLADGIALVVPAGIEHNILNTGDASLKLYTIYSPANHPAGTVHATKAEAMAAEEHHH
ncbi:MAG: cupin domain-containing protein [Candidatus Pacebacteria bacterium]|nr:cupin domain-containing protein [Candidatus Paceibacterota bacterium]